MCIVLWDKEKQYFKMKLNDIPEGDTHAHPCAHPCAYPMLTNPPIRTLLTVLKIIHSDSFMTKFWVLWTGKGGNTEELIH